MKVIAGPRAGPHNPGVATKRYMPGTSPDEVGEAFGRALDNERKELAKLPKKYKKGEGVEQVVSDDHLSPLAKPKENRLTKWSRK